MGDNKEFVNTSIRDNTSLSQISAIKLDGAVRILVGQDLICFLLSLESYRVILLEKRKHLVVTDGIYSQ